MISKLHGVGANKDHTLVCRLAEASLAANREHYLLRPSSRPRREIILLAAPVIDALHPRGVDAHAEVATIPHMLRR